MLRYTIFTAYNEAKRKLKEAGIETYGFEARAIVTMEEVVEHLYNHTCQGKVVIDDALKAQIDKYYEQYGCR